MPPLAHLGIEYTDLLLRAAVWAEGQLHLVRLVIDELPWFDPNGSVARPQTEGRHAELGVSFPGFFRIIGAPEAEGASNVLPDVLRKARTAVEMSLGLAIGHTVIAVPTALMSLRRSILVGSAEEAGLAAVDLVDAAVPCAIVYSSAVETPTTQLVYYLNYGECEYALLRVVRGRVKVLDSGIAARASGQLFDLQLMEAVVLALREKGVFLGLNSFRVRQWLEFRKIAARARRALAGKTSAELILPPSLTGDATSIRFSVSSAGLAAQAAPAIRTSLDEIEIMLERNEIKPSDVDAVIALGDVATRYPAAAMLAQIFPGKVMLGDVNTVAAAAAAYSSSLSANAARIDKNLSFYLSRYVVMGDPPVPEPVGSGPPVVTGIVFEQAQPNEVGAAGVESDMPGDAATRGAAMAATTAAPDGVAAAPAQSGKQADDLRELGRQLIEVGTQILHELQGQPPSQPAIEDAPEPTGLDQPAEPTGAEILIRQAEDLLRRGLHAEAINLSHRAYSEASFDGRIFAAMLRIHVDAADAMGEPEQYHEAIQVLMCAHSHGRTDRSVQRALAARHLKHAHAMLQRDEGAALAAVKEALRFDPQHPDALAIFDQLCGATAGKADQP